MPRNSPTRKTLLGVPPTRPLPRSRLSMSCVRTTPPTEEPSKMTRNSRAGKTLLGASIIPLTIEAALAAHQAIVAVEADRELREADAAD